jgi:uncharacterized protein YhhL (DUF1145 family)
MAVIHPLKLELQAAVVVAVQVVLEVHAVLLVIETIQEMVEQEEQEHQHR